MRIHLCAAVVLGSFATAATAVEHAAQYAVFAENTIIVGGFNSTNGIMATNGSIHWPGIAGGTFLGLRGAGNLDSANAGQTVTGDVIFNGHVALGTFSDVSGSIHAGKNLWQRGNTGGSIVASGDAVINGTVGGNVTVGQNAYHTNAISGDMSVNGNVETHGNILGHLTYGGTLTKGAFNTIGSISQGTVPVNPLAYVPAVLPAATAFTSGGPDVKLLTFEQRTLAPGSYGNLWFNGVNTLNLSSGAYSFDSINSSGGFGTINLNLANGPIAIYVAGDAYIEGGTFQVNGEPIGEENRHLAADVLLEIHGDAWLGGTYIGTIFAPNGSITTRTFTTLTGSMLSKDTINLVGSVDYVATNMLPIPEPAAGGLLAMATLLMLRRRRG